MGNMSYEDKLRELFAELKAAHENRDELLAFSLITEVNRLKAMAAATATTVQSR